jgi:hypothetical protein
VIGFWNRSTILVKKVRRRKPNKNGRETTSRFFMISYN